MDLTNSKIINNNKISNNQCINNNNRNLTMDINNNRLEISNNKTVGISKDINKIINKGWDINSNNNQMCIKQRISNNSNSPFNNLIIRIICNKDINSSSNH